MVTKEQAIKDLRQIPGVGKSIANDLWNIGIKSANSLKGLDPATLYKASNEFAGCIQDPCLLYVFRCAVYYANTPASERNPDQLKWWNWKE